jgi:hypothetical protein
VNVEANKFVHSLIWKFEIKNHHLLPKCLGNLPSLKMMLTYTSSIAKHYLYKTSNSRCLVHSGNLFLIWCSECRNRNCYFFFWKYWIPRKIHGYPLDRALAGSRSRTRRCGVERNNFPFAGFEHRPSSLKLVSVAINLFRLLFTNKKKLCGPLSASELYRLSERHLSTKFSANICG